MEEKEVLKELCHIGQVAERILEAMPKRESKFSAVWTLAASIVSALGILGIIDTVIKWVTGG